MVKHPYGWSGFNSRAAEAVVSLTFVARGPAIPVQSLPTAP